MEYSKVRNLTTYNPIMHLSVSFCPFPPFSATWARCLCLCDCGSVWIQFQVDAFKLVVAKQVGWARSNRICAWFIPMDPNLNRKRRGRGAVKRKWRAVIRFTRWKHYLGQTNMTDGDGWAREGGGQGRNLLTTLKIIFLGKTKRWALFWSIS